MQVKSERRSQEDRSEAMRQRLIAAARGLFADKGYADTGTPEIVAAAGVTRGALYHHFADKMDLFRAVVVAEAQAVAGTVTTEAVAGPDSLRRGADAWFRAMEAPGRVRILLRDGPAVLGKSEMARIDAETGGATLREGLAAQLRAADPALVTALSEVLSAGFDRAALAITEGADPRPYRDALMQIIGKLAPG